MIEIRPVRGPLPDEQLGWIAELYGGADRKYASLDFLRHQFNENPFGWSAHIFVLDGETRAGHCVSVPFRARSADRELVAGKIEAVVVAEAYRGRDASGRSVALDMLKALYPWSVENGCDVLFGLAPEGVARLHERAGCRLLPSGRQSLVLLGSAEGFASRTGTTKERVAVRGLAAAQHALSAAPGRRSRLEVAALAPEDAAAAEARADEGEWTISGADAWDWFRGAGPLRAAELRRSRAIVRFEDEPGKAIQLVSWRPRRATLREALGLVASLSRLALRSDASSLRLQPWQGSPAEAALVRAFRLLGAVTRPDAELILYDEDPRIHELRPRPTPFFHVTF